MRFWKHLRWEIDAQQLNVSFKIIGGYCAAKSTSCLLLLLICLELIQHLLLLHFRFFSSLVELWQENSFGINKVLSYLQWSPKRCLRPSLSHESEWLLCQDGLKGDRFKECFDCMMMIDEHTTEETHKKNPGIRLWWFEAHWPSFVVVLLQLLHVLLRGLGDGWRQLGLEFIEEGESLTRRTDIV